MYHVSGDDVGTAVRLRQVVKYGNAYMRGQVGGPGPSAFYKAGAAPVTLITLRGSNLTHGYAGW
jgi:hypothetical protein